MKTSPVPKPPETKMTDVEKLDAPLSNRAFFLGVAYLAQAIAVDGGLARGAIKEPPQEGLDVVVGYSGLCLALIKATDPSSELGSKIERERSKPSYQRQLERERALRSACQPQIVHRTYFRLPCKPPLDCD